MNQIPDEMAEIASRLAAADFSSDEDVRERVRRKYLRQCEDQLSRRVRKKGAMCNMINRQRPILAVGVLVIALLAGFMFYSPGSLLAAVNQATATIVKTLKIGDYVSVIQVSEPAPPSVPVDKEARFTDVTDGQVWKEGDPAPAMQMIRYDSLDQAKKAVAFPVLVPQYLPAGYSFAFAESYPGSDEYLNLYFTGKGRDIILMLRVLNEQTGYEMGTDAAVEAADINGHAAAWVEPHTLIWDQDGVDYSLFGKGQSKSEIFKIARSFK